MQRKPELDEIRKKLRDKLPTLARRYSVKSIGIFGSYLYGAQKPDSDLDLLVDFEDTPSLLQFVGLEIYLSEYLGVKVDLVMRDSLKPRIGKRILNEVALL